MQNASTLANPLVIKTKKLCIVCYAIWKLFKLKKKKNVVRYTILTYRKDNLYNMNHKYAFLEDNKELETIYRATYYDYIFFFPIN